MGRKLTFTYHLSLITYHRRRGCCMKRLILSICGIALTLSVASGARAQRNTAPGDQEQTMLRDVESEKAAKHELEVARHYFKNKKAYYAAFKRCEELAAGYPEFYKIDEVLYIAGMSSLYLSERKGKQQPPASTPEKREEFSPENMRETARDYLTRLVNEHPKSDFVKEAQEALARLGEAKPKAEAKQQ